MHRAALAREPLSTTPSRSGTAVGTGTPTDDRTLVALAPMLASDPRTLGRGDRHAGRGPGGGTTGLARVTDREHPNSPGPFGTEPNTLPLTVPPPGETWVDRYTTLLKEIESGFPVVGRMSSGLGWKKRLDMRYAQPMRFESFLKLNEEHVLSRLHQTKPDPHWHDMLSEISQDIEKDRMIGPLTAPPSWGLKTIPSVHHHNTQRLLAGPNTHAPTSFAFSVEQTGADGHTKVRRCEDWKRSRRNETVEGEDIPPTHRVNTFIAISNEFHRQGFTTHLWGADHESAYRQLPVAVPDHTHVLVRIPGGWTLWKHRCLLFGSTASVWAYTRTADMICWLCRALTLSPMVHYVDDYASIEPPCTIQSGFECVHRIMKTIGFKFKPSKDQPPAHEQHIQGVVMTIDETSFTVSADPGRIQRLTAQLNEYLHRGSMSSDEAHRLAGKLQFISEAMMSQTIRCCLQPLYARAATPVQHAQTPLGDGLTDALKTVLMILPEAKPRHFEFRTPQCSIVYADAYFQAGDQKISVGRALQRNDWRADTTNLLQNGWGFIIRKPNQECLYAHGQVPGNLLGRFTSRRAFIYALEIIAQLLCLVAGMPHMERMSLCFIDNEPGKFALLKGFGKDTRVNRLLALLWHFVEHSNHEPHWERVTSQANISDAISRGDVSRARELGWKEIEFDWSELYNTLTKATQSMETAMSLGAALAKSAAGHHGDKQAGGRHGERRLQSCRGDQSQKGACSSMRESVAPCREARGTCAQ